VTARHTRRRIAATLILIAAGVALALPGAILAQAIPEAVTLTLGDYAFSPAHIEVAAGTPVILTLTNKDVITPHNFTLQNTQAGLDIDTDVGAGRSVVVEFTPRVAGTYRFHCNKKLPFMKSHLARGMEGTLTVTRVSAH
jgi:plastocyanin